MATIVQCDMCDKIQKNRVNMYTATITYSQGSGKTYDLCASCLRAFRQSVENLIAARMVD